MRFIGGKARLLGEIDNVIKKHAPDGGVFCDIFAGTGSVARYFKPRYEIHANDFLHFSYVIQKATVESNSVPAFTKLAAEGIPDPLTFLESSSFNRSGTSFIADNYAPGDNCGRMYFTRKNAERIDFIRSTVEAWKEAALVDEAEYYYLLASLIEGVPFVSNTTGTYGAYLKAWDRRALKDFKQARLDVTDNGRANRAYNRDANELIRELSGDILYIDPPYNDRQYAPNYHLLETISRYDSPAVRGVTGMRGYAGQRSRFSMKHEVLEAFEDLVANARFGHIVMSYSAEGLMGAERIEAALKRHGAAGSYARYDVPYRRYMSKIHCDGAVSGEYIFYVRKEAAAARSVARGGLDAAACHAERGEASFCGGNTAEQGTMARGKPSCIKSPLNYIGGKYKQLPEILPRFPKDAGTFVDLFAGGCSVGVNASAGKVVCNDINSRIIELFNAFKMTGTNEILRHIEGRIDEYNLTRENEAGFLAFRKSYNASPNPLDLYVLSCFSFNYQFRFNNAMEYNNPFGRNRSRFSQRMRNSLLAFLERIKGMNVEFTSFDFTEFDFSGLKRGDMVYCDPPYLITTGSYNDGNRGFKDWKARQEAQLFELLDALSARGISFALSNVLRHKGTENRMLLEWSGKYNAVPVSSDYSNASYNTTRGGSDGVLIMNY